MCFRIPEFTRKPVLKNGTLKCLTFDEKQSNPITIVYGSSDLLLSVCMPTINWRKKFRKSSICSSPDSKVPSSKPNQSKGVHVNDLPIVGPFLRLINFSLEIDSVDGKTICEFTRQKVQTYENTMRILTYNNSICYVRNINAVFHFFCCPSHDTFN